jgi:histidinol dehydrogenase
VAAAKRIVAPQVGVSCERGAGELIAIADRSATPGWLAADLLSEAERGDSGGILVLTHYRPLVARIQEQITKQLKAMASAKAIRQVLGAGAAAVVTRNLSESITLANRYAPEKVLLAIEDPEGAAKQILNAGTVFLGHYTPLAMGGTLAGPNQLLPTGGSARFSSPLAVEDFLKRMSFAKFEAPKLRELGVDAMRLAHVEGLEAGSHAVDLRLQKIRRARREREAAREAEVEI